MQHELKTRGALVSRMDLIIGVGLAAATLVICLFLAPRGFHAGFVDMGHDGYQLRQVLDLSRGGVIFRDTFDQYGPLNGYLNTVGFLALGRRLLAVKYFISGWYSLIAVVLFVMARRWLSPALAALSTIVWLGLAPFYGHGIMISAHVYVLFFQALATIVALRSPGLEPRRFALVGVLTGLSWSMKQSMGTLFFLSILAFLVLRCLLGRDGWRRVAKATTATSIGFFTVIGILLALLWSQGAFHDWYLQTVAFPREFYLQNSAQFSAAQGPGVLSRLVPPLAAKFVQLQFAQPLYWVVIRVVVLMTGIVQVVRRRPAGDLLLADDLLLMASITAFLWLGAFPSSNFMHQWWTASLSIAPFVVCVRTLTAQLVSVERAVSWMTVALVSVIVGPGVLDRERATVFRVQTLTETILEPPVFRGIRTDPSTKRVFETLYRLMARYRSRHPGTKIVSIDASDGWWTGINESLPLLSFFDDNTHSQPVYWSLPVLTTVIYSHYTEALWSGVRAEHPLIVEQHYCGYKPARISGYTVLAAAQSDSGYWYVYAPDRADQAQPREVSTFLASDGARESGFVEHGTGPKLIERLSSSPDGAWRGRIEPSFRLDEPVQSRCDVPFVLIDPAVSDTTRPFDVYTWPADLPVAKVDRAIEPVSTDPIWRADIVRELAGDTWTVDGQAQGRYSYLLQFPDQPIARGASFILRGELLEGAFQLGFLEHGLWSGSVVVSREGPFEAVLEIQKPGRYSLILANAIQSSWWERVSRHAVAGTLALLGGGFMPNHFRISQAGWVQPRSLTTVNSQ